MWSRQYMNDPKPFPVTQEMIEDDIYGVGIAQMVNALHDEIRKTMEEKHGL